MLRYLNEELQSPCIARVVSSVLSRFPMSEAVRFVAMLDLRTGLQSRIFDGTFAEVPSFCGA